MRRWRSHRYCTVGGSGSTGSGDLFKRVSRQGVSALIPTLSSSPPPPTRIRHDKMEGKVRITTHPGFLEGSPTTPVSFQFVLIESCSSEPSFSPPPTSKRKRAEEVSEPLGEQVIEWHRKDARCWTIRAIANT